MAILRSKPIIRWAGSKRKLLPVLLEKMPKDFGTYIEPFCGSACLFFELPNQKAILGDINGELINTYKVLKSSKTLYEDLVSIPVSDEEYYRWREMQPEQLSNKQKAIRFLYLNRYCFNGIYRTNSSGKFNVPVGKKTGGFPEKQVFEEARKKLYKARLINSDYQKVLRMAQPGDFVYFDPPYSKSVKFTGEYGVGSFNVLSLPGLMAELDELNERGVQFLFSYRGCSELAESLSAKYIVDRVNVKRHISGFKTEWNEVEEILVRNYE